MGPADKHVLITNESENPRWLARGYTWGIRVKSESKKSNHDERLNAALKAAFPVMT